MSEELLQLLFFAFIFIALPALERVLRGRKKRRGPVNRGPTEEAEAEVEWEPAHRREAPWDSAEDSPPPGVEGERTETAASSEGLLPADLWEELAALARGEQRPDRVPSRERDVPDSAAEPGTTEAERAKPRAASSGTADAEDFRAPSSLPAAQRSRAPRPLPQKPVSRAPRRSWREVESREPPLPTGGPTLRRPALAGQEAFPGAEAGVGGLASHVQRRPQAGGHLPRGVGAAHLGAARSVGRITGALGIGSGSRGVGGPRPWHPWTGCGPFAVVSRRPGGRGPGGVGSCHRSRLGSPSSSQTSRSSGRRVGSVGTESPWAMCHPSYRW